MKIAAKPQTTQSFNPKTCRQSLPSYIVVSVVGPRAPARSPASGPGAVQILFRATAPGSRPGRKGQCNTNGQPRAKARSFLLVSVVLTTK